MREKRVSCVEVARAVWRMAQQEREGGSLVLAGNIQTNEEGHVAFVVGPSPEELEQGTPFVALAPWSLINGRVPFYEDLEDFRIRAGAERVKVVAINPEDDFDEKLIRGIVDLLQGR